jgi:ParB family chromosome partitioning protein
MADQETAGAVYEKGRLYTLPIGNIQPDPNQPRKYFDAEGLAELTESIRDKGVLQPVLVRSVTLSPSKGDTPDVTLSPSKGTPDVTLSPSKGDTPNVTLSLSKGDIFLIAGERRLKAAEAAGLTEVPALFVQDERPQEIALIENSLRQNLTAVEEAEAAGRLVDELGYTQDQVARVLGKKRTTVSEILSLNRLPAAIRDECRVNPACPRRVLVEIARKKQERGMLTLYEKYKAKGLTSDEVRAEAKKERKAKAPAERAAAVIASIEGLRGRLGKLDWATLADEERTAIQEAVTALSDALNGLIGGQVDAGGAN